jgi:ABC-type enterochelin transport system substrate-binding protein
MKIYGLILCLCILLILPACGSSSDEGIEGVIVTFEVAGSEQYKIQVTDPENITIARDLLAGNEGPKIPNGIVVRGDAGVNEGYSWHIDPDSLEFADMTTEVCDGLPLDVENEIITSEYYCPWAAEVIAIEE